MKDPDSVPPAFADCLGGLMSVIAQNIRLTITAAEGVTLNSISCPFPKSDEVPGKTCTLAIGDMFSEEERDILVDISVPPTSGPTPAQPLLQVIVKYLNVISASTETHDLIGSVERTAADAPIGEGSTKVDQQRNRIKTAQAMEEARRLGERGQLQQAQQLLSVTHAQVAASPSAAMSADLMHDLTSVQEMVSSTARFKEEGSHRLMNKSVKHNMQRACESDEKEVQSYANASKGALRSMFKK